MNRDEGTLQKIKQTIKSIVLWKKIMILVPIIILLLCLLFAVIYVEVLNESVMCAWENCDTSISATATLMKSKKEEVTQEKYQVRQTISTKNIMGKIQMVEGLPHQRETNQPITDIEFKELADKMKIVRNELVNMGLDEEPENYGTIPDSVGFVGNIDTTGMDHWEMANEAARQTGWHPLFIISQWQLETGHFTSNNYKKNNNVAGQTWYAGSKYPKGTARPSNEGGWYIKYPNPVVGYVDFVLTNQRYKDVKNKKTPEEQAKEVARQGWAVDPNYASKLISMIEKNRKKFGDAPIPVESDKKETGSPSGDPLNNTEGDKVVAEAYRVYNERGINSSNPIKYSMPLRAEEAYGDCSEFTMNVYKKALGIDIGFTTIQQIEKNAQYFNTDMSKLQPGDLVYFNSPGGHGHTRTINGQSVTVDHTGIYVGDNKFIDLSSGVGYISVKGIGPGEKYESYFKKSFIGFIRIGEPGSGTVDGVIIDGRTYDEAEVHARALANTDWYALEGAKLFETDKHGNVIKKNGKAKLREEYKGTMVEKTYLIAMEIKEDPEDRMLNYVSETRIKKWDETDWMLNTRFLAYNCYLLGDEPVDTGESKGFFEWIGSLFDKGPCETLDDFLSDATGGKMKTYIEVNDRGVLKHYYQKTEYSYTCHPPPPPPEEEEEDDEGSDDGGSETTPAPSPPVHRGPGGPQEAKGLRGKVKLATHNNMTVGKNQHNCEYGYDEHKDITTYPEFPSLYSGAKNKSVLKNFEKYTLILPGKNTSESDTYPSELERILRMFYGDALNQNTDMISTIGGGIDFIVPMEDGTYNFSSAFQGNRCFGGTCKPHRGVDMGTQGVSGVPIYSTSNGIVVSTGWVNGYGYTVMVKHDNGYYSFYAHMLEDYVVVKKDQVVRQAQLVGGVDGVPNLAEHLHFEVCERAVESASGNLMCADHVDPEDDDDSVDGRPDDVKLTFNPSQDKSKSNEMSTKFLKDWKENAKNGKIFIMPGYSSVTGSLSESFENKDGGCVNNASDDGGMSCGFYQFANNRGKVCGFVNWLGKNNYSDYYNYFNSYCPSGVDRVSQVNAFMSHWAGLKKDGSYPSDFKTAQYIYIKAQHYDPVASTIYNKFGLNVNERHVAVQEMIWSIGVQQPGHAPDMFSTAGYSSNTDWDSVTDREIIEKIYKVRHDKVPQYFSSSPDLWDSLRNRFINEKEKALAMLGE